jgi:2'-5' RNA ligase
VYCLWLTPSSTDGERLSVQIKKLADRSPADHPAPVFDPHVTFLSGLSLETDVEVLKRDVRRGLKAWSNESEGSFGNDQDKSGSSKSNLTLNLDLEEPINGGSFYTAMIYPVAQEPTKPSSSDERQLQTGSTPYDRLLIGRSLLQNLLSRYFPSQPPGYEPKPYFPHLSLQYSSLPKPDLESLTREFIAEEERESTLATKVELDRCALMRLDGEVREWEVVVVYKLDGEEIQYE